MTSRVAFDHWRGSSFDAELDRDGDGLALPLRSCHVIHLYKRPMADITGKFRYNYLAIKLTWVCWKCPQLIVTFSQSTRFKRWILEGSQEGPFYIEVAGGWMARWRSMHYHLSCESNAETYPEGKLSEGGLSGWREGQRLPITGEGDFLEVADKRHLAAAQEDNDVPVSEVRLWEVSAPPPLAEGSADSRAYGSYHTALLEKRQLHICALCLLCI